MKEICHRRYLLKKTAVEIFFIDGTSIFLNFPDGGVEEIPNKLIRLKKTKCLNLIYHKTLDPKKLVEKSGL